MHRARAFLFVCGPVLMLAWSLPPSAGAQPTEIYKQLITTHRADSSITVIDSYYGPPLGDSPVRWTQTWLVGSVWQNASDIAWTKVPGVHPFSIGGAPAPDVMGFFAAKLSLAHPVSLGRLDFQLNLDQGTSGGPPVYYSTAPRASNDRAQVDVNVRGTAVWMLQDGLAIAGKLNVNGTAADRLIIVAHSTPSTSLGIDLNRVLSPLVPVILVTDAQLGIQHIFGYHNETMIPYFSAFAEGVTLMGPLAPTTLTLLHDSSRDDDILVPLDDAQALPNVVGGTTPVRAQTWGSVKVRYRGGGATRLAPQGR